jgi:transcriptional regulator with XRE-family HTH domain
MNAATEIGSLTGIALTILTKDISGIHLTLNEAGAAMARGTEKFGEFVRRQREAREIGLREMAKMIGVSPTYLSKVERDEFPPPAEDKVRKIAEIIGCDSDELLGRAGRVSSDLSDIIKRQPVEYAALLRTTKGFKAEDIARLAREAQKAKEE